MITLRIKTEVKDDRRVVLTLPPEVPIGQAELVVTIEPQAPDNKPARTSHQRMMPRAPSPAASAERAKSKGQRAKG